jgi:hypothetical protein
MNPMSTMNSMPSDMVMRDIVFSKIAYSSDIVTCQMKRKDGSQNRQAEASTRLDWQPKFNPCKKRPTLDNAKAEALHTTVDSTRLVGKNCSDQDRTLAARDSNSNALHGRHYKKQRMSITQILSLESKVATRHHRRNNACISLEEVLKCASIATLLLEQQTISNPQENVRCIPF